MSKKRRYLMWLVATLTVDQRNDEVERLITSSGQRRATLNWDIEQRRERIGEAVDALAAIG